MENNEEYLYVGKIVGFHGIKGEVKLKTTIGNRELTFSRGHLLTIDEKEYWIEDHRRHKDFELLKIRRLNDLNAVQFLKNKDVYINIHCFPNSLVADKFILLGYTVIVDNEEFGKVSKVVNYGSCDILVVTGTSEDYFIAYLDESIIAIDKINKIVTIRREMIV